MGCVDKKLLPSTNEPGGVVENSRPVRGVANRGMRCPIATATGSPFCVSLCGGCLQREEKHRAPGTTVRAQGAGCEVPCPTWDCWVLGTPTKWGGLLAGASFTRVLGGRGSVHG